MGNRKQPRGQDRQPGAPAPIAANRRWDLMGVVVASLVGLLALLVSGYTAWIQRQQVRAEVWPRLVIGANGLEHSLVAINKGTGPAIVRSAQVSVDGRPQSDWDHVLGALGLPTHGYNVSTIGHNVLSPGEELHMLQFTDPTQWEAFQGVGRRVTMDICFCSTLDDCWVYSDRREAKGGNNTPKLTAVEECPRLPSAIVFDN